MATVTYHARERRLIVDGVLWPDEETVAEAIETHACPESTLTVDLTRLPYVPSAAARAIEAACRAADARGCRTRVWALGRQPAVAPPTTV